MNIKENVLFLRNEWTTTGQADKTDKTELRKCIHLYNVTQGNKETSAFDRKFSSSNARKIIIILKEEGSKEEDRQEEADVKNN